MRIEFLYFEGCPNHEIAMQHLKDALSEASLDANIEIITVEQPEDAVRNRFLGSPSIRIDGKDLEIEEDASTEYSMRCRRYKNGDVMEGFPSKGLIKTKLSALKEA